MNLGLLVFVVVTWLTWWWQRGLVAASMMVVGALLMSLPVFWLYAQARRLRDSD